MLEFGSLFGLYIVSSFDPGLGQQTHIILFAQIHCHFPVVVPFNLFSISIDICPAIVSYAVSYSALAPSIIFTVLVVLLQHFLLYLLYMLFCCSTFYYICCISCSAVVSFTIFAITFVLLLCFSSCICRISYSATVLSTLFAETPNPPQHFLSRLSIENTQLAHKLACCIVSLG